MALISIESAESLAALQARYRPKCPLLFTGAGMSAESGIATFRGNGGLWEEYAIEEVATPQAWERHPERVLEFYNRRRRQLLAAEPHAGHFAAARIQWRSPFPIITQNIDDLHERAGATRVWHLHGELRKARSTCDGDLVYPIDGEALNWGMQCEKGSQLRPHVVWFGEAVPAMAKALEWAAQTDFLVVVGSSLQVYPAAGLLQALAPGVPSLVIDPEAPSLSFQENCYHLASTAKQALPLWESFSE